MSAQAVSLHRGGHGDMPAAGSGTPNRPQLPLPLLCCVCEEKNTTFRYEVVCHQQSKSVTIVQAIGNFVSIIDILISLGLNLPYQSNIALS